MVLGPALAVVGSFQDTYRTIYRGTTPAQTYTTSLWFVTSESGETLDGAREAYYAAGVPVLIAAALLVVAAVLTLRDGRTALIGRPLALVAAGALAGIVFSYVLQLLREEKLMNQLSVEGGLSVELTLLDGTYLLIAGTLSGLTGAALAQRKPKEKPHEEKEAVVVHQLGDDDDDTPPFGIEIPGEEQQETR